MHIVFGWPNLLLTLADLPNAAYAIGRCCWCLDCHTMSSSLFIALLSTWLIALTYYVVHRWPNIPIYLWNILHILLVCNLMAIFFSGISMPICDTDVVVGHVLAYICINVRYKCPYSKKAAWPICVMLWLIFVKWSMPIAWQNLQSMCSVTGHMSDASNFICGTYYHTSPIYA